MRSRRPHDDARFVRRSVRSGSHGDLPGAARAGVRRRVRSVPVVVPPVLSASQLARLGARGTSPITEARPVTEAVGGHSC
jgi:hypothetical protein